jgi:hypothetical protein
MFAGTGRTSGLGAASGPCTTRAACGQLIHPHAAIAASQPSLKCAKPSLEAGRNRSLLGTIAPGKIAAGRAMLASLWFGGALVLGRHVTDNQMSETSLLML